MKSVRVLSWNASWPQPRLNFHGHRFSRKGNPQPICQPKAFCIPDCSSLQDLGGQLSRPRLFFAVEQGIQQDGAKSRSANAAQGKLAKFQGEVAGAQHQGNGSNQQIFVV